MKSHSAVSDGNPGTSPAHGSYGSTSGTESRGSRPLIEDLMVFSLSAETEALREEEQYKNGDRNSATLAKEVDFRVLLTVLRSGATLEERIDARASVQLLEGTADLTVEQEQANLEERDVAVIDAGRSWLLRATSDCALLLTLAWPREKTGV